MGEALRTSASIDLAGEARAARPAGAGVRRSRMRPRVLAGGTLGLTSVGAALLLALSGSTASPAFAITKHSDGTVLVQINQDSAVRQVNAKLVAMGTHEQIAIDVASGPASVAGPVNCVPQGANVPGPSVRAVVGTNGTEVIPSGNTGAGTWHLAGCHLYSTSTTGGDLLYGENGSAWSNTGNSGG